MISRTTAWAQLATHKKGQTPLTNQFTDLTKQHKEQIRREEKRIRENMETAMCDGGGEDFEPDEEQQRRTSVGNQHHDP